MNDIEFIFNKDLVQVYDFATDTWSNLPPLPDIVDDFGCGLATKTDGSQHIVAVYEEKTEVLDLGSDAWR